MALVRLGQRNREVRRGAAVVELAVLAPFLVFLLLIAVDFARIFFRSATNHGIPCLTFVDPGAVQLFTSGEGASVLLEESFIESAAGARAALEPVGAFIRRIWSAGGLLGLLDGERGA